MASFFLDGSNNRYYTGVRQVEYNGNIYVRPTAATYLGLGFTEVTIDPRPDDRFYIVSGPADDGSYTSTARNLSDLQTSFVRQARLDRRSTLSGSDEYVLDAFENSTTVQADWAAYRSAVRSTYTDYISDINSAASVSALVTVIDDGVVLLQDPDSVDWITVYQSSGTTSTIEFVNDGGTVDESVNSYVRAVQVGWEIIDSRISDSDATTVIAAGSACTNVDTATGETTWNASTTLASAGEFQIKLGPAAY